MNAYYITAIEKTFIPVFCKGDPGHEYLMLAPQVDNPSAGGAVQRGAILSPWSVFPLSLHRYGEYSCTGMVSTLPRPRYSLHTLTPFLMLLMATHHAYHTFLTRCSVAGALCTRCIYLLDCSIYLLDQMLGGAAPSIVRS